MAKTVTRLYKGFQPETYQLELDIDPLTMKFTGSVIIEGKKSGQPSNRLTFHQNALKIISADIVYLSKKGQQIKLVDRINHHQKFHEVRLHSSEKLFAGTYRISLQFEGKITESMTGLYPGYYKQGVEKQMVLSTQFESHHAREVFPCIDEPEAKATFSLTLRSPENVTALSNTRPKSSKISGSHRVTTFETTPKMSTYLLAFVVGDLVKYESKTKTGVDVTLYACSGQNPDHLAFAADITVKALEFFEDYFGVAYPMTKSDQVALPEFESAAMENWGLITYRESCLLVDPKSSSIETKQTVAEVICHELSHQWFGNLVTMKWWDDLWLNESFANMMAFIAVDELFSEWNIWEQYVATDTNAAMRRDALANVQSVRVNVNHPDEIGTLFDPSIVYAKGGSLLRMLWSLLDKSEFRAGLKNYFEKHAFANTTASDLWKEFDAASGSDIGLMMKHWISDPGYPIISIEHQPGADHAIVAQERFVIGPNNDKTSPTWHVPLATTLPVTPNILTSKHARISIDTNGSDPLLFNHQSVSYFLPHYTNKDHFAHITKAVQTGQLSTIDRLQLLTNYTLLQRAGVVKTTTVLQLLESYSVETEEPVWSNIAAVLAEARRLVAGDVASEQKLNAHIRNITKNAVQSIDWDGKSSDTPKTQRLRNLLLHMAAAAEMPEVIAEGKKRFKLFKRPADLSSEVRDVVYFVGARYGNDADFKKLLDLYRATENAEDKDDLAASLLTTRNPKHIATLLAMIKTEVRLQDIIRWYARLMGNYDARAATWQWLKDEWSWVHKTLDANKTFDYVPRYAAQVFSHQYELDDYRKFFEPKKSLVILSRAITIGDEDIAGKVAWRKANESSIKKWLSALPD